MPAPCPLPANDEPDARRSRRRFLGLAGGAGAAGVAVALAPVAATPAGALTAETGVELGYAESVKDVATGRAVAIPNLALVVPLDAGPLLVEYGSYVTSSVSSGLVKLYLLRDGNPVHEVGATVAGAGGVAHLQGRLRIPAGQTGSATFTVLLASWSANATVRALASPMSPAFLQARRV